MRSHQWSSKARSLIGVFVVIFCISVLSACQTGFLSYRGVVSKPESRLALAPGGEGEGLWETTDVSLTYRYAWSGRDLRLSGEAVLPVRYGLGFRFYDWFFLTVNFLDTQGVVIASKGIFTSDYRKEIKPFTFSATVTPPPGTAGLAFSYYGRVGQKGEWEFWRVP